MLPWAALLGVAMVGCLGSRPGAPDPHEGRRYPPAPQLPRVIALGTLRGEPPPSRTQVELAMFLFGTEPPSRLAIANPTGLAAVDGSVWICDHALSALFRWEAYTDRLVEERCDPPLEHPFAVDITPAGDRLIGDRRGVRRIDAGGRTRQTYVSAADAIRPGGVLAVGDTVWVSDLTGDCLEVFDLESGRHLRRIGRRGSGPAQFARPRSLARVPDGHVCVVDLLNNRVQVLTPEGEWVRDLGGPGGTPGRFGRPRDVAVGPDGTVFVTDAFSQRVHAFAPDGAPLLAFGEPGSGIGELVLPGGIAVSAQGSHLLGARLAGQESSYFVYVSEQLSDPGIRVYAWLRSQDGGGAALPASEAVDWKPQFPKSTVLNPHWDATRCDKCHQTDGGQFLPIEPARGDALCLTCHDGVQAPADPHPIGRPAVTKLVKTPDDWPTVEGAIGCMTCHDIRRHCDAAARRPAVNTILLRGYDPQRPLDYCMNCHGDDVGGRFSPHRQRDATGRVRDDACLFCHTRKPEIFADGRRRFEPHLRTESSSLCLNCHSRHWDLSPLGHVDRPVTPKIREWMLLRELRITNPAGRTELERLAREAGREPARLPLGDKKVTCYTCHNPHYAGMFPPDSEVGALATNPPDRKSALRSDWIELCSECHHH